MIISGSTGVSAPSSSVNPTIFHATLMPLVRFGSFNVVIVMNKLFKKSVNVSLETYNSLSLSSA